MFSTALLSSCSEDQALGLQLQPAGDQLEVGALDTFSIQSFSVKEDSLRSDENTVNLVGSRFDNSFGLTTASFATHLRLPAGSINFGTGATVDSVVLAMVISGYYGDTLESQTYNVYKLTEKIHIDSAYYSNGKPVYDNTPIGSLTFTPRPKDSVLVGGVKSVPQVRIKLDNSFGQDILNLGGTSTLSTNDNFLNYLKGIYIKPVDANGKGSILYINYASATTRVMIHYQNTANDSLKFELLINGSCARVNYFDHNDYAGSPAGSQLADSTLGKNEFYVQSLTGLKGKIKIPGLTNVNNTGKYLVNKAEIIFRLPAGTADNYAPHDKLILLGIDSLGRGAFLSDILISSSYFGGDYNSTDKTYRFTISNYAQDIISGKRKDYGLYLVGSGAIVNANRTILGGSNHIDKNIKFKLTLTKIN